MPVLRLSLALPALLAAGAVTAGPVSDFETGYRQMYASYRAALFKTNAGNKDESAAALTKLADQMQTLSAAYGDAPPPQYEDDAAWAATITDADALIARAREQVSENQLPEAHETLEGVRDIFGDLHLRNGIETFSDRMNAYHAEMEELLAMDLDQLDAAQISLVHERAAVLAYLADQLLANPPVEAADNAEYDSLSIPFAQSVAAMLEAARSGDPEQIKTAAGKLKVPYSKLFLKFG